tara:strand:+ start:342 stop:1910 length:1569 start_codon:yes stop_codon:yes gene_type:complete
MAAIITDQLRILNAKNFVAGVASTANSYYSFVGLPNPTDYDTDWNTTPPGPTDNFNQEDNFWDTMIGLKKISKSDVRQVVRKTTWTSGTTYDMYRSNISASNVSLPSNAVTLYDANYYVINSDYRVYECLQNGTSPDYPSGRPSLDEPTFTDLEPREAGTSGDGYIWKYLYTISPSDIVKFDSTNYLPVPQDWETNTTDATVRDNASSSGQLKVVEITNRGVGVGTANKTYTRVPIQGDGSGAEATITINNDSKVDTITVSNGGSGYTFGTVDLVGGNVPTGSTNPSFDVIIPPQGGHGADIYRELGAYNVLLYSRIENDTDNPDFITGNQIARVGVVESPQGYDSESILTSDKASAAYALKLTGTGYSSVTFDADAHITQTIGIGSTAFGRVINYDSNTGVLKYWQDKFHCGFNTNGTQNTSPTYGFKMQRFTADIGSGGNFNIIGGSATLGIQTTFGSSANPGVSTVINSKTYNLGQSFIKGVAQPEVKKYSGEIIYVDNRPAITRSTNQKEDIKVILQF